MSGDITTTIIVTTTMTSTKILTQTILSTISSSAAAATAIHTDAGHGGSNTGTSITSSLYEYSPSLPLCIIFIILFFIATLHHAYLCLYLPTRPESLNKHRYTIPLFIASLLSLLGYLTRSISIQKSYASNLSLYTISTALILVSPIFICATLYLLLTRLILRCLPAVTVVTPMTPRVGAMTRAQSSRQKFFLLPPRLLSVIFIASDIVSFATQCLGAGIAASNDWLEPELTRGIHILLAGLTLQLATFVLFVLNLHLFGRRVRNSATTGFNPCIMKVLVGAWVASGFVLMRTAFRLVDFALGPDGYAYRHEWCLYVFEALPVWVALAALAWWHPVKWVQERLLAADVTVLTVGGKGARGPHRVELAKVNNNGGTSGGPGRKDSPLKRRSWVGFTR